MDNSSIYPWQREQWAVLQRRLQAQELPHALLLHGEAGLGVDHFAGYFLRTLLCSTREKPCGNCRACKLYASGSHPDFLEVLAGEESREIRISQIRTLTEHLQTTCQYGNFKVAWVCNADAMNRSAANALLKTLEEPPAASLIVLSSHFPFRLPATVRSRCQGVRLVCSGRRQAGEWLAALEAISEGEAWRRLVACRWRPLQARRSISGTGDPGDDPGTVKEDFFQDINSLCGKLSLLSKVVDKWQKQPPPAVLHGWLLEWAEAAIIRALIRSKGAHDELFGVLPGTSPAQASVQKLFSFYDRQKYRYYSLKQNFDRRLLLEAALIEWQLIHRSSTARGVAQGHQMRWWSSSSNWSSTRCGV